MCMKDFIRGSTESYYTKFRAKHKKLRVITVQCVKHDRIFKLCSSNPRAGFN